MMILQNGISGGYVDYERTADIRDTLALKSIPNLGQI